MKGLIIAVVILAGGYLLWAQPWKPKRYNDTAAGQEARRIDEHVQQAFDWRDKTMSSRWPAKDYIGTREEKGRGYGLGFDEAKKFTDESLQAGAVEVSYINIKRSVRYGDSPEGIVVVLPEKPGARAPVFARFAKEMASMGKPAPTDVNQKYLYIGFGDWTPQQEGPGWLPN
jgi:hypothetical protein